MRNEWVCLCSNEAFICKSRWWALGHSLPNPIVEHKMSALNVKGKMISFPKLEPSSSFVVILPNLKHL